VCEYDRRRATARQHGGPLLSEQVPTLVRALQTEARTPRAGQGKGVPKSWFEFLIARWELLPDDLRQQMQAYNQLERTAEVQAHRSLIIKIKSLETALKTSARRYGWKGEGS
jgi:hypothetical protein